MLLRLILTAVAGMLAAFFLPTTIKGYVEPFLRIAAPVSAAFMVAIWWLAKRLRRDDVGGIEKFARRVLFRKANS